MYSNMSNTKATGKCIFCGKGGLTKQHVWPDWLRNVVPRLNNTHEQSKIHVLTNLMNKSAHISPSLKNYQGHQGVRKIRNVCKTCNGGWMSRLETKAKPLLSSMILQNPVVLEKEAQAIIASWVVMTSIVAEFTDQTSMAIPISHRGIFMKTVSPPSGWKIWIGKYEGEEWIQRYRHHGFNYVNPFLPEGSALIGSVQFSTFVVGSLLIHAASSTFSDDDIVFDSNFDDRLIQIWPIVHGECRWPPDVTNTDKDTYLISDFFPKQLRGGAHP